MKLQELFENEKSKKIAQILKDKKKMNHMKEKKMKMPPQSAGIESYQDNPSAGDFDLMQ